MIEPNAFGKCLCGCGAATPLARHTDTRTGTLKGYPVRYLKGHGTRSRLSDAVRFEEHLYSEPNTGCKLYVGKEVSGGYGRFRFGGIDNGRLVLAHHAAWLLAGFAIPEGMCLLHKCDTPACCSIDHLFLGTRTDNNLDRAKKCRSRKGRYAFGVCARGKRFLAQASVPLTGVTRPLGTYDTEEQAHSVAKFFKEIAYGMRFLAD